MAPKGDREELFILDGRDGNCLLYAPLRRAVASVNSGAAHVVAEYLKHGREGLNARSLAVIGALEQQGVLGGTEQPFPIFPADYAFTPIEVTLFLTSRCNLRCRYCYAEAGHKSVDMPWSVARSAIDLVAGNAGLLGNPKFAVGFHGGGEPTLAWDLMRRSAEYAREKGDQMGLDVELFTASNGLLSSEKREYIARVFSSVTISLDGPKDIQDYNRPQACGSGSFDDVRDTLEYFNQAGFPFWIRATITIQTVNRMEEIVSELHRQFAVKELQLEPAWQCGRCLTTGEEAPEQTSFAANFRRAVELGRALGMNVTYSGARLDMLTSKFCAAPGDGFSVLPEGVVTSCFEVTDLDDSRAGIFHYGRFDPAAGAFTFDQDRIAALRKLSVEHLSFCRDCFCKWHCAGDCLAKAFADSGSAVHNGSTRCALNRALMQGALIELVAEAQDGVPAQESGG